MASGPLTSPREELSAARSWGRGKNMLPVRPSSPPQCLCFLALGRNWLPRTASSQFWLCPRLSRGLGLPREEDPQTLSLDYRSFLDLAFLGENRVSVRFLERVGEYKLPQVSKLSPLPLAICSGTQRYASRDKHISCPHPQHFCSHYPAPSIFRSAIFRVTLCFTEKVLPSMNAGVF